MTGAFDRNPFVGPRPLARGEPLHGRGAEVRALFNLLQARRIVVLHAPSGAGKSSLVQAGLTPRLTASGFDVWRPIRVNVDVAGLAGVPPGTNRFLLSAMVSLEEELPAERRRTPAELAGLSFADYVAGRRRRRGREERPRVLLFDQFEEVLTVDPLADAARRAFFDAVGATLERGDCWALFVVREDYLAAFAPYRARIPTQLANTFRLDLLGLAGAREAAEQLAQAGGRTFPGVERLIRELSTIQVQQPGGGFAAVEGLHVEPLHLQVVGRRLWASLSADDRSIEEEDIVRHADVSTALREYYADALRRIAGADLASERAMREWVGGKLVVGGIRSQVRQEVGVTAGLDNDRVARLLDCYLVRAEQRVGATWYELSHDRLVEPIAVDNQAWEAAHLHPLQVQARAWNAERPSAGLLMRAEALAAAEAWAADHAALLTAVEREFLDAARELRRDELRQRRRRLAITAGLVAIAVITTGLGVVAWQQRDAAVAAGERARAAAWLGYVRSFVDGDPTRAVIGLAEVGRPDEVAGWLQAAVDVVHRPRALAALQGHRGSVLAAAFSADGTRVVTAGYDGTARVWRADGTGAPVVLRGHAGPVRSAVFFADGTRVVTASEDNTARVWGVDGTAMAVLAGHAEGLAVLTASPSLDGARVVLLARSGAARVWATDGGGAPVDVRAPGKVVAASFMPDGRILTTAEDGAAWVWPADGGEGVGLAVVMEADSPEGERSVIVTLHGPLHVVRKWSRETPWEQRDGVGIALKESAGMHRAGFSADGLVVWGYNFEGRFEWSADGSGERRVVGPGIDRDGDGFVDPENVSAWLFRVNPGWGFGVFVGEALLAGETDPMHAASPSADGARVVTVRQGLAQLWRADGSGLPVTVDRGRVAAASFTRDGTRVLTFARDEPGGSSVQVYEAGWGDAADDFAGHGGPLSPRFGGDGRRALTLWAGEGDAREARLWDGDGRDGPDEVLRGHLDEVLSARFSPDGLRGLTTSRDGTARVWDLDAPFAGVLTHEVAVKWAGFAPDGVVTIDSDHGVGVWPLAGGGVRRMPVPVEAAGDILVASLHGRSVATGGSGQLGFVWDGAGAVRPLGTLDPSVSAGTVLWATFGPDGQRVLTSAFIGGVPVVRVWDVNSGALVRELAGHTGLVLAGAFSADGRRVVTGSDDTTARVWRLDGEGESVVLAGHTRGVRTASFGPDGERVVTGSDDSTARIWRGSSFVALTEHRKPIYTAAFSGDGRTVLTASEDGTAMLWSPEGAHLMTLEAYGEPITWAALDPDGTRVVTASAGGTPRIWPVDGRGPPLLLHGHRGAVNWAAFDGAGRVVTASDDGTARVWSLDVATLRGEIEGASSVCVPAEDRVLYLGEAADEACARFAACERSHGRPGPALKPDGSWVDWPRCRPP